MVYNNRRRKKDRRRRHKKNKGRGKGNVTVNVRESVGAETFPSLLDVAAAEANLRAGACESSSSCSSSASSSSEKRSDNDGSGSDDESCDDGLCGLGLFAACSDDESSEGAAKAKKEKAKPAEAPAPAAVAAQASVLSASSPVRSPEMRSKLNALMQDERIGTELLFAAKKTCEACGKERVVADVFDDHDCAPESSAAVKLSANAATKAAFGAAEEQDEDVFAELRSADTAPIGLGVDCDSDSEDSCDDDEEAELMAQLKAIRARRCHKKNKCKAPEPLHTEPLIAGKKAAKECDRQRIETIDSYDKWIKDSEKAFDADELAEALAANAPYKSEFTFKDGDEFVRVLLAGKCAALDSAEGSSYGLFAAVMPMGGKMSRAHKIFEFSPNEHGHLCKAKVAAGINKLAKAHADIDVTTRVAIGALEKSVIDTILA